MYSNMSIYTPTHPFIHSNTGMSENSKTMGVDMYTALTNERNPEFRDKNLVKNEEYYQSVRFRRKLKEQSEELEKLSFKPKLCKGSQDIIQSVRRQSIISSERMRSLSTPPPSTAN